MYTGIVNRVRPLVEKIEIDPEVVRQLAKVGATQREMAAYCRVSLRTMARRLAQAKYREAIDNGNAQLYVSLRRKQVEVALAGNPTMLIWLGKQLLGQKDRLEHCGTGPGGAVDISFSSLDELRSRIASVAARIPAGTDPQLAE